MSLEIKPLKFIALPVKLRSDTETVIFGVESFQVFNRSRKPIAEKSTTESPRRKRSIFVMENIFGKKERYSKQ